MLTSDSFSERMITSANFLVETHWFHLNDEITDEMIVLRMNKTFMKRVITKKAFSSRIFGSILSDESAKV